MPAAFVAYAFVNVPSLLSLVSNHRVLLLTGAGCSTKSGIPDYRGVDTGRAPKQPIQHAAFLRSAFVRRRYWARSCLGWPRFAAAQPNATHLACAALEDLGRAVGVVSQNVDGLHQAAGSRSVIELHGSLSHVTCLACGQVSRRADLQEQMLQNNPGWVQLVAVSAPDGDADLPEELVERFYPPACACGGALMPNVVFFGGNVKPPVLEEAWSLFGQAELLLVVGSSLTVFSGYRFVRKAVERAMPVVIVNRGRTRGDDVAALKVDAEAGDTLTALVQGLASGAGVNASLRVRSLTRP
ncbi:MAG: NAD-dependent protein deacetylase [Deltaproteobacteria bacterium]|nr:NAD-dependent protein deacetylase [Deltaproteobacteria bacterium]